MGRQANVLFINLNPFRVGSIFDNKRTELFTKFIIMEKAFNYLLFTIGVSFTIVLIWQGYQLIKILLC